MAPFSIKEHAVFTFKVWMKSEYGLAYERAIDASTKENREIWFDPRYWTTMQITAFFEDLALANNSVWELTVRKLTNVIKSEQRAQKRYKAWLTKELQWQDEHGYV